MEVAVGVNRQPLLRLGMRAGNHLVKAIDAQVCVDLRRRKAFVSKKLLYGLEVRPSVQ